MIAASAMPPSVDACLEPEIVRPLLQQALRENGMQGLIVERLHVVSARRNASRRRNPHPLTLCYEAAVRGAADGVAKQLQFYGKVYRQGASALAARGAPVLHLPQLDMVLWRWPADPVLRQIPLLLDPAQTLPWWGAPAAAVSVLRYQPEVRATLRYSRHADAVQTAHLYAKTFCDARGEAIHQRFTHFWNVAQQDAAAPRVARPLAYHPPTQAFWQAQAPGVPLRSVLSSNPGRVSPACLANAIASVHAAPLALAGTVVRDVDYWLTEIHRRRNKIARVAPHLALRAERVAERLRQIAAILPPRPPTLIHGDCHPDQMWLDGEQIVLFDFDEFALGDPMEDVAAFVTKLAAGEPDRALSERVVASYRRIAPRHFCPLSLQWHLAIQQLLQTTRAFIFQVSDWRDEVARHLSRVELLCASAKPAVAA